MTSSRLIAICTLAVVAATGPLFGCGGGGGTGEPPPVVAAVSVSPDAWKAERLGQRQQLTATATDTMGNVMSGVAVAWESSDPAVARVDSNGLLTAYAAGDVVVTATADGISDSATYSVSPLIEDAKDLMSPEGDLYTVWSARSEDSPALVVNGKLRVVQDIYCRVDDGGFGGGMVTSVCPNPIPPGQPQKFPAPVTPWRQNGVVKFQWEGDRIGLLSDVAEGAGTFRAVDRHDEWTELAIGNAVDFQLERDRIAVLHADGTFRVKDGIHGPWTILETNGLRQFQLERDRIGVLREDGTFRVKDGINGAWTVLANAGTGVETFQLEGDLIAELRADGLFRVKDGIDGAWTVLANAGTGVRAFQLEGNRIGALHADGLFRVKDGINGAWTVLANAGTGVTDFQLQEDFIGMLGDEGRLRIKQGIDGEWRETEAYGAGAVTQFRLVVDVPAAPWRTSVAVYNEKRTECDADDPVDCEPVPVDQNVLPAWYGRFCGADRPADLVFQAAVAAGPVDSLDFLCIHHDYALDWYPGETTGVLHSCVVRYGLRHARVTRDGTYLPPGSPAYDAVWSRMPELKQGVDAYVNETDTWCSDNALDEFTTNTAARHNRG